MRYVSFLLTMVLVAGCSGSGSSSSSSSDNHFRAKSISAGGTHACGVTSTGVKCWGSNANGAFGDGTTTDSLHPTAVGFASSMSMGFSKLLSKVEVFDAAMVKISASPYRSCGILDGAAYCWGGNGWGQNGDGTNTDSVDPVAVLTMDSDVTDISTGVHHSCGIKNESLYCWGSNSDGQLGDGNSNVDTYTPVAVTGMGSDVTAVGVGYFHTCAIMDAAVYCWGQGNNGAIGDSDITGHEVLTPYLVSSLNSAITGLAVGTDFTCVIMDATVKCWGNDRYGQLGDNMGGPTGHGGGDSTGDPQDVVGITDDVVQIAAGEAFACALTDVGAVYCWGANSYGNIGIGDSAIGTDQYAPVQVTGLSSGVKSISIGINTACAIKADDSVVCWGENQSGQIGNGTTTDTAVPDYTLISE